MRYFVYIMATFDNQIFHVGYGKSIDKIVEFYKKLPALHENSGDRLVYFEQYTGPDAQDMSADRFHELTDYTWDLKAAVITGMNPDMIELKIGVNCEI